MGCDNRPGDVVAEVNDCIALPQFLFFSFWNFFLPPTFSWIFSFVFFLFVCFLFFVFFARFRRDSIENQRTVGGGVFFFLVQDCSFFLLFIRYEPVRFVGLICGFGFRLAEIGSDGGGAVYGWLFLSFFLSFENMVLFFK